MKYKSISALIVLLLIPLLLKAQTTAQQEQQTQQMINNQKAIDDRTRQNQREASDRLQKISDPNYTLARNTIMSGPFYRSNKLPLTRFDKEAIAINPDDRNQFAEFLKQPKTGVIRLHSTDICTSEKYIIQANSPCPINVTGKATSFSFRTRDYVGKMFSDVLFDKDKLFSVGTFTLGVFSNLGDVSLNSLNLNSDGIKQLAEYQPASKPDAIERENSILKKGVVIAGYVFKGEATVKLNNSYVLRTIAFDEKLYKKFGTHKFNILENDERKDVIIVFRVIRMQDDGSITLIWKELNRKSAPKIETKED